MIQFVFIAFGFCFVLLILSFIIKDYAIGMLSAMAIMILGIHTLIGGIDGFDNLITLGIGVVAIGLGSFIFLNGTIQQLEG